MCVVMSIVVLRKHSPSIQYIGELATGLGLACDITVHLIIDYTDLHRAGLKRGHPECCTLTKMNLSLTER